MIGKKTTGVGFSNFLIRATERVPSHRRGKPTRENSPDQSKAPEKKGGSHRFRSKDAIFNYRTKDQGPITEGE